MDRGAFAFPSMHLHSGRAFVFPGMCYLWFFTYYGREHLLVHKDHDHWHTLLKLVVRIIASFEGNLFTFGLICYFYPGSPKPTF